MHTFIETAPGTAELSTCGRYRYQLSRTARVDDGTVLFIGVNPSTADAAEDDQTVRKWKGFTARWGYGAFLVGNLFAWRARHVQFLETATDPVGPENDYHLTAMIDRADLIVPCWGDLDNKIPARLRPRADVVRALLRKGGRPVQCLGTTRGGHPRHPLTLGYVTPLRPWSP